jgi:hypothetical protein
MKSGIDRAERDCRLIQACSRTSYQWIVDRGLWRLMMGGDVNDGIDGQQSMGKKNKDLRSRYLTTLALTIPMVNSVPSSKYREHENLGSREPESVIE